MGRCFLGGGGVRGYFCPSTVDILVDVLDAMAKPRRQRSISDVPRLEVFSSLSIYQYHIHPSKLYSVPKAAGTLSTNLKPATFERLGRNLCYNNM